MSIGAAHSTSGDVRIYAGGASDGDLVATFADDLNTTLTGNLTFSTLATGINIPINGGTVRIDGDASNARLVIDADWIYWSGATPEFQFAGDTTFDVWNYSGVSTLAILNSGGGGGVVDVTMERDLTVGRNLVVGGTLIVSGAGSSSFVGKLGAGTTSPNAPLEVKGLYPGTVGGFPSGILHVTTADNSEFANSVITGHNAYAVNTQLWYLGSTSNSNNDIAFINRQYGSLSLWTNDIARFTITKDGTVGIVGEVEVAEKAKITAIGGYCIRLNNDTGFATVKGQLVIASAGTEDSFDTAPSNSDEVIGIVLDAGIADQAEAWIVWGGKADVLIDGGGCNEGDRMISSTTAGSADVWNTGGAVATHFQEVGHSVEQRTGAGLARCSIHFL